MAREVIVETSSKAIANGPHLGIETSVLFLRQSRDFQGAVSTILVQGLLAVDLCAAPQSRDEVLFDAPKIILGLGVGKAENSTRVGAAKNVRHTVSVAIDRHLPGE